VGGGDTQLAYRSHTAARAAAFRLRRH
jgi:hypothetical protein